MLKIDSIALEFGGVWNHKMCNMTIFSANDHFWLAEWSCQSNAPTQWICSFVECFSCLPTLQCPSLKKMLQKLFRFLSILLYNHRFYLLRSNISYPPFSAHNCDRCTLTATPPTLHASHHHDHDHGHESRAWRGPQQGALEFILKLCMKHWKQKNCPLKPKFHWFHSSHWNVCTVGGAMQTRARAGWTCRHSVSIMTHVTSVTRVIWSQTCAPPGLESGQTKRLDQLWRHMVSSTSLQPWEKDWSTGDDRRIGTSYVVDLQSEVQHKIHWYIDTLTCQPPKSVQV